MRSHVVAWLAGLSGVLAASCLLVWASPSRLWGGDAGPWVYYPLGDKGLGVGVGISGWIVAAAWFVALGILVGLLSSVRVSRAWFAMALLVPVYICGALFGFLVSFLGEPPPVTHPSLWLHPYTGSHAYAIPLELAVSGVAAFCGLILTRSMLGRFERRHVDVYELPSAARGGHSAPAAKSGR
jgi:hypothetical protein